MSPQHSIDTMKSMELEQDVIGSQFEQVAREIFESEQAHRAEQENEDEKERFAEAARAVERLMILERNLKSEDTSTKFGQLNFLKLMALILARQVEISSGGDKLVERSASPGDRSGSVRAADAMRVDREESAPEYRAPDLAPDYHRPMRESESVRPHLPDPLAHIREGGLSADLTPLQAARIVSGGQVQPSDWTEDDSWSLPHQSQLLEGQPHQRQGHQIVDSAWQEMYDDYKNDDDR